MKRIAAALFFLLAMGASASAQEQTGIPARMTAANGKEIPVFLQDFTDGSIVFQVSKNPKNQTAPVRAITLITFLGRFDPVAAESLFNVGDYQGMVDSMEAQLKPSLDAYWPFMAVPNNYQDLFTMLMKAYLRKGDASRAREVSAILMQSADVSVKGQAESIGLLAALGEGSVADAEAMLPRIKSEAGKLYLGACIERAKGDSVKASVMISDLIHLHANDLDWMPQAELLSVHLYMDQGLTNTAINTARQVKSIYANSNVATDAEKLHKEITLAKERAEAVAKEKADAEAAARAEVKARAAERAKGYGFDAGGKSEPATEAGQSGAATGTGTNGNVGENGP